MGILSTREFMALFSKISLLAGAVGWLMSCSTAAPHYYTYGNWGTTCVSQYLVKKQFIKENTWVEFYYNKEDFRLFNQDTFTLSQGQLYSHQLQQYLVDTLVFAKKKEVLALLQASSYQGRDFPNPDSNRQDSLKNLRQQQLKALGLPANLSLTFLPKKRLYQNGKVYYLYESSALNAQFVFDQEQGIIARTVGQQHSSNFCSLEYQAALPDSVVQLLPSSKQ